MSRLLNEYMTQVEKKILSKDPSSDGVGKYGSNHYCKHVHYSSDEKHRSWKTTSMSSFNYLDLTLNLPNL